MRRSGQAIAVLLLSFTILVFHLLFGIGQGPATAPSIQAGPPSPSLLQVIVQVPEAVVVGQTVPIEVYTLYNGSLTTPTFEQSPCAAFPCIGFRIVTSQGTVDPGVHVTWSYGGFGAVTGLTEWNRPGEWNTSFNMASFSRQLPGLYTVEIPVNYTLGPGASVINLGVASFFAQPAQPTQPTPASANDLASLASTVGTVQAITYGILGILVFVLGLEILDARKKNRQRI